MEFSDRGALTQDDQSRWLRKAVAVTKPFMPLALSTKSTGQVIGYVLLAQDLERVDADEAELGCRLRQDAWGQGYGTEAVTAMLHVARSMDSVCRVVAIVDPNNSRSLRVVTKAGMVFDREIWLPGYDYSDHRYSISVDSRSIKM